ncbi:MAG: NAD(P)-binding protein [bacterium]
MKEIQVHGAGLSGLTAAINLARAGFRVVVFEREKDVGGSPQFHPSAHLTPMHGPSTWEYIGIDLGAFFGRVDGFNVHVGDRRFAMDPSELYVVERGGRNTSLDRFLYGEALKLGVEFEFNSPITPEKLSRIPEKSIIATGLHPEMFKALGIPSVKFEYFIAVGKAEPGNLSFGFWNHYTPDYGYVAITNGLMLALVFSRVKIKRDTGEKFARQLRETEGIEIKKWRFYSGANPLRPTLFAGKHVVAGNLGGMMEPVFTFGIVGALHSGRIAALAVADPPKAVSDFREFTKAHRVLRRVPPVVRATPWFARRALLSAMLNNPDRFKTLTNYIMKGIPGYKGPNFIKRLQNV